MSEETSEVRLIVPEERQQKREVAPAADANPSTLLAIAVRQGASVEQMTQLLALQERFEANEARKAFVDAMAAFKSEPLVILKKQRVDYPAKSGPGRVKYSHANLADVTDVVGPAMAKHGLSYRWEVGQDPKLVTVTCVVTHQKGHAERVTMTAPLDDSGGKNPIQQVGSSVSYLERYTLLAAVGMSTREDDDDGQAGAAFDPAVLSKEDQAALEILQAAAMEGEPALQKAFQESAISDTGWNLVSQSLIDAAKKADKDRKPATKKAPR